MATNHRRPIIVLLYSASALAAGCELFSDGFSSLQNASGPRKLSDDDAFRHLQRDRTAAAPQDLNAVQAALDLEVARAQGERIEPSDPAVIALMKRSIRPRLGIDEDSFIRLESTYFVDAALAEQGIVSQKQSCSFDLNLSMLQADRYLIPQVDKVPVRNQGGRGTCAAFAGTASVEYAALNPREGQAAALPTLDLSEEYFYWSSKPDCQVAGACDCPGCGQGSWYGSGFGASVSAGGLNIPLEGDCDYDPVLGRSDTHHPLPSSCDRGAVQVEAVDEYCGADDLVGLLHRGYAVPWASPLTTNWEQNDGLITRKGAGELGDTIHAGGHAYLIVGYRRLPDMPDEGGMCFMVKNSWGAGWGINGYACMTLAWMRAVTYDGFLSYGQPAALRVRVREDLATGTLPDDDDQGTNDDLPDDGKGDGTVQPDPPDVLPEPIPPPQPPPEPEPGAWRSARMYGPDDTWFRVETQVVEGDFFVRGEVVGGDAADGDGRTRYLRLNGGDNGTLVYKGDEVGRHDLDGDLIGGSVRLCTAEWAHLCALRYRASDGLLYVQFRDDDLRSVKPEEVSADRGEWFQIRVGGNTYGLFMPGNVDTAEFLVDPKTYLRLGDSQPARLSLRHRLTDPTELSIRIQGYPVGRLNLFQPDRSSLCSGDFANRCQIVNDGRLTVVPRNSGKL